MLEFIIVMIILDLLMKWQVGTKEVVEEPKPPAPHKDCNKSYACGYYTNVPLGNGKTKRVYIF